MTKDIQGFEGLYQIEPNGKIWSVRSEKYLNPTPNALGYHYVTLFNEGTSRQLRVHRLVAKAYLDNPDNLPFVNHMDKNVANNDVSNLEWCTRKHNEQHSKRYELENVGTGSIRYDVRLKKWKAFIKLDREIYIGVFSSQDDAESALYGVRRVLFKLKTS